MSDVSHTHTAPVERDDVIEDIDVAALWARSALSSTPATPSTPVDLDRAKVAKMWMHSAFSSPIPDPHRTHIQEQDALRALWS